MKKANRQARLRTSDLNFSSVSDEELVACCHYEYARESSSIAAFYNEGLRNQGFPSGSAYPAIVEGRLIILPNPFVWIWSRSFGRLFSDPWQEMSPQWRRIVCEHYEPASFAQYEAFMSGDSQWMTPCILSRGEDRSGIDRQAGIERIVVEIGWGAYPNAGIVEGFAKWVELNRPEGIGWSNRKGKDKLNSWRVKLERLAVMRLLHHSTFREIPSKFPAAWETMWPKGLAESQTQRFEVNKREFYRRREEALCDFHRLFPFLPEAERPLSWETQGGRSKP